MKEGFGFVAGMVFMLVIWLLVTIAYDEGKIIGVLEGSGGVVDHIREIIGFCKKPTRGVVVFDKEPEALIKRCLQALGYS